jgi:hypothetical protein
MEKAHDRFAKMAVIFNDRPGGLAGLPARSGVDAVCRIDDAGLFGRPFDRPAGTISALPNAGGHGGVSYDDAGLRPDPALADSSDGTATRKLYRQPAGLCAIPERDRDSLAEPALRSRYQAIRHPVNCRHVQKPLADGGRRGEVVVKLAVAFRRSGPGLADEPAADSGGDLLFAA